MIIDQLNVFTDTKQVLSSASSEVVELMPYMGRASTLYITVLVREAYSAGSTVKVDLEESDDNTTFTTAAASFTLPTPTAKGSILTFSLPANVKKPYLRLKYTITGTPTTGKLFAVIGPEQFAPYDKGLYINAGKVVA